MFCLFCGWQRSAAAYAKCKMCTLEMYVSVCVRLKHNQLCLLPLCLPSPPLCAAHATTAPSKTNQLAANVTAAGFAGSQFPIDSRERGKERRIRRNKEIEREGGRETERQSERVQCLSRHQLPIELISVNGLTLPLIASFCLSFNSFLCLPLPSSHSFPAPLAPPVCPAN